MLLFPKEGTHKRECRKFKKEQEKEKDNKEDKSTVAATSNGEVIIVYDDNFVGLTCDNTSWLVDSGACFHVTPRADFTSYTSGEFGYVRLGNEGISKFVGKGNVCLKIGLGCTLVLKDVNHVPDICLNLISTASLMTKSTSTTLVEENGS